MYGEVFVCHCGNMMGTYLCPPAKRSITITLNKQPRSLAPRPRNNSSLWPIQDKRVVKVIQSKSSKHHCGRSGPVTPLGDGRLWWPR